MIDIIDVYLEFASPEAAQAALSQITRERRHNSAFCTVVDWKTNYNPCVIRLDLFGHTADVPVMATTLGARRATRAYIQIWPMGS